MTTQPTETTNPEPRSNDEIAYDLRVTALNLAVSFSTRNMGGSDDTVQIARKFYKFLNFEPTRNDSTV